MKNKKEMLIILCFYIPLMLIALFYLLRPTDAISEIEKRSLQQRPDFSITALANGSFSKELERFFTDQLPFREFFIASDQFVSVGFNTIFGMNKVQLVAGPKGDLGEGENLGTDGKDLVTFPAKVTESTASNIEPTPRPTSAETMTETSTPTPQPTATPTTVAPTIAPTTGETAVPTPVAPVDIQQSGNILIMGDRAVEIFYSNQSVIDHYVTVINNVAAVNGNAQVYSLVAPTASQFYTPEGYRSGSSNQQQIIPTIYEKMSSTIKTVDAYAAIAPHTDEYIYFRTDHHWTGLGAYYAYTAFAQTAGIKALPLSSFSKGVIDGDFLGTLYAWSNSPSSLKENPDYVEYWQPPITSTGYAFTDATMSAGYAINLIKTDLSSNNKYLAFTEGDHGLAKFETSNKNGRSIMVIKESYGNAMVPFLAAHYENVYVFDPRKAGMTMSSFVASEGIDDILVVNYSLAIGNAGWKDALYRSLN